MSAHHFMSGHHELWSARRLLPTLADWFPALLETPFIARLITILMNNFVAVSTLGYLELKIMNQQEFVSQSYDIELGFHPRCKLHFLTALQNNEIFLHDSNL